MATVAATQIADIERSVQLVRWLAIPNGDDGAGVLFTPFADRSVQITGTFGAGGSVSIEGSNDGGTTWTVLKDPLGAALTFTATGLRNVGDIAHRVRPRVTAGDGTTALNVNLVMRAGFR
jgi:hypothetical protein